MVEHKGDNKTFRYTVHTVSYEQRGNTKQILPQLVDATGHMRCGDQGCRCPMGCLLSVMLASRCATLIFGPARNDISIFRTALQCRLNSPVWQRKLESLSMMHLVCLSRQRTAAYLFTTWAICSTQRHPVAWRRIAKGFYTLSKTGHWCSKRHDSIGLYII
jgi:hypothetical protein